MMDFVTVEKGNVMAEYIDKEALRDALYGADAITMNGVKILNQFPSADVEPVRHGRWILEAHDERVNYRWTVTAECSECCDEQKEIWAGFFPNVPPPIARYAALVSAESVKLSNYCPNCGCRMDGGDDDVKPD